MFPFDLPGPQFLVFYALFAIAVLAALHLGRRHLESGPLPSLDLKDPLLFACLRGGPKETLSVAALGLIDRGLLHATGRTVTPSSEAKPELVGRRVELRQGGLEQGVLRRGEPGGGVQAEEGEGVQALGGQVGGEDGEVAMKSDGGLVVGGDGRKAAGA